MAKTVIEVNNISKRYRIGLKEKRHDTFVGQLGAILKAPITNFRRLRSMSKFGAEDESVFWALKDINFEVKEGEVLGIIGHNGAGKSTLLKILSRITEPTSGSIHIKGRIAALLEVGTGFHPDLTGRENVYMNGTILGMTRREIDAKFDEIVDFSGVEKYIDTPVKFYSSGMKVRLGFAVAAHLEPEILIIDEVLAVGDAEFQRKCLGKMQDVAENEGRTVLFVSHNMNSTYNLCSRCLLLNKGLIEAEGATKKVIKKYLDNKLSTLNDTKIRIERTGEGSVIFDSIIPVDKHGVEVNSVLSGSSIGIQIRVLVTRPVDNVDIGLSFHDSFDNEIFIIYSSWEERLFSFNAVGYYSIRLNIHPIALNSGTYNIKGRIMGNNNIVEDWPRGVLAKIEVSRMGFYKYEKEAELRTNILVHGDWFQS